jgi:predicted metal-dependent phosphoesterase TrpH
MKADLHVHSWASFDVPDLLALSPVALFNKAIHNPDPSRRMDYFALTDHDTMDGYRELMEKLPEADRAKVIPAVEHSIMDPTVGFTVHTNLYGLTPRQYDEIRFAETLDELLEYCESKGIIAQYNHPAWWERTELKAGKVDFTKVRLVAGKFRIMELSSARTHLQNRIAVGLANDLGLTLTASTDTHTGDIGKSFTIAPGATQEAFLDSIRRGVVGTHLESLTRNGLLKESRQLIDEFLYRGQGQGQARNAGAHSALESVATGIIRSRVVQSCKIVRGSLRLLMRGISPSVIRIVMRHESRLENRLADTDLRAYMLRTSAQKAA